MSASRLTLLSVALVFAFAVAVPSQAQDDAVARAAIANGTADLGSPRSPINAGSVQTGSLSSLTFDADTGAVIGDSTPV